MAGHHLLRIALVLCVLWTSASALALGDPRASSEPPPQVPEGASGQGTLDKDGVYHVTARLLLDADGEGASDGALTARVGVLYTMDPSWHIYWRSAGQAGVPTSITWRAVDAQGQPIEGVTFSPLRWPAPLVFEEAGGFITTYGYADEALLTSRVTLPASLADRAADVHIEAKTSYLACKIECVPGESTLRRPLLAAQDGATVGRFARWAPHVPAAPESAPAKAARVVLSHSAARPGDQLQAVVIVETCAEGVDAARCPRVEPDAGPAGKPTHAFIPETDPHIAWTVAAVEALPSARGLAIRLKGKVNHNAPGEAALSGVVKLLKGPGLETPAHLTIRHKVPMLATGAAVTPSADPLFLAGAKAPVPTPNTTPSISAPPAPAPSDDGELGLLGALVLAFFGGMILNLMPCVLPVLSLKIGRLAEIAHEEDEALAKHGAAYTAGILVMMWTMAGAVLVMRALGHEAGWGFQFQSAGFLVGLSALLVGFAINLFGAFEVNVPLGGRLGRLGGEGSGVQQSFAEGLLCVLLSTPCSAPFLGTAMGFALASSAPTIVLSFTALGLGLAAPFVALLLAPGWRGLLPKPGPWLLHLKQFLGFTLLATSVWLLWLLGQLGGVNGMARVLSFLVTLALALWVYGLVQYTSGARKHILSGVALLVTLAVSAVALPGLADAPARADSAAAKAAQATSGAGWSWQPWSERAVAEALASGRPVLVDFTADWCITCKVNEHNVLAGEAVAQAVKAHHIVMLKADWTRRDDTIRAVLKRHGKAGVPMYLVYLPNSPDKPLVLPELLTERIVIDAFAGAK